MSFATVNLLSEIFVPLLVPVVIVAVRTRTNGPLLACALTAIVCFAALWLLSSSQAFPLHFGGPQDNAFALRYVLYAVASVTAQAAWVLAVYHAALARHVRWIAALAAAQVVTNAALLFSFDPCIMVEATNNFSSNGCAPPGPLTLHLISAAWLFSPGVALAYALRARLPRGQMLPTGLTASAPDDESALELHTERL